MNYALLHYCDTEYPSIPTTTIGGGGISTLATVKKIKVLFINDQRRLLSVRQNIYFTICQKIASCGVGRQQIIKPLRMVSHFQGIDTRIIIAQTRGLQLSQSKFNASSIIKYSFDYVRYKLCYRGNKFGVSPIFCIYISQNTSHWTQLPTFHL